MVFSERLLKEYQGGPQETGNIYIHGQKVVQHFLKIDDLGVFELEKMWRRHFLVTMQPKYLPSNWSLDQSMWDQLTEMTSAIQL